MGIAIARLAVVALLAAGVLGVAAGRESHRANACGAAGPFDFDTYEAEDFVTTYNRAIELVTAGKAFPSVLTVPGGTETIDVTYPGLLKGPRGSRTTVLNPSLSIPPSIYKSIVWVEATWNQASFSVPYGGVGPALRSFDCGYGLGQVTSGMSNPTGSATAKQAAVGTHFLFNIAEGVRILAEKWNSAPRFRPIAGNGDPAAIEDWYYAIWSYNGFAFSNHPLNPSRDPLRGTGQDLIYHCSDASAPSYQGGAYGYGDYTYPERVYGCLRYPPRRNGQRMWPAQTFDMPHFEAEVVAKAFEPSNFTTCEGAGFSGGCPKMDFPTTLTIPRTTPTPTPTRTPGPGTPTPATTPTPTPTPSVTPTPLPPIQVAPHFDNTPPVDPALAFTMLGNPTLTIEAPEEGDLSVGASGANSIPVKVTNTGSWVGLYRVRTSAPWVVVRHAAGGGDRTLDGGVVVGPGTEVVTQAPSGTRPRLAQPGFVANLVITLVPSLVPPGTTTATVWIEPLLGSGAPARVDLVVTKASDELPVRVIIPGVGTDE